MTSLTFDRKRLARDTLSAISRCGARRQFVGHDGREYAIVGASGKADAKTFIDVVVKTDGVAKAVARYAIVPIGISRQ